MKVRRYFAADMRSALAMVRESQGPDVIILSNRKVADGIELLTADEDAPAEELARLARAHEAGHGGDDGARTRQSGAANANSPQAPSEALWTREPVMEAMRAELQSLRQLVEGQMAGLAWGDLGKRHPQRAQMLRRLVRLGFTPRLAQALVDDLPPAANPREAWHMTLALLARRLAVAGDVTLTRGGVYALVGPTGVGKTTLVAKLAARHVLAHGPASVALITTDHRRVGAHDQLRNYARILGVPVWIASSPAELRDAIDAALDRRLVLVDTAGAGHRDGGVGELGLLLAAGRPQLQVMLVIAAVMHARVLQALAAPYAQLTPVACVITKLDEAACLGTALGAAVERELPVAYVSAGDRIPEDLESVSAAALVARAVKLGAEPGNGPEDVLMEEGFADDVGLALH